MSRKGSAYILVLVVGMSLMLMLAVAGNISSYEAKVSSSYKNYANLSQLAESGIERGILYMNTELDKSRENISDNTITVLSGLRLIDYVDFLYAEVFKQEAENILLPLLNGKTISYSVDGEYNVTVALAKVTDGYTLTSTANKAGLSVAERVTAKAILGWTEHEESVQGNLIWSGAPPAWLTNGVTENFYGIVNESVFADEVAWSEENPVLVTRFPTVLDVSLFPEDTVFISLSAEELFITASDPSKSHFRGTIFAYGDISVSDVNISGAVISRGAVVLSNAAVVPENLLPPSNVKDKLLLKSITELFNILPSVDFDPNRVYIINSEGDIRYRAGSVKYNR